MPPAPYGETSPARTAVYRPVATLTLTAPSTAAGRSVAVGPQGTVIGRDAGCHFVLANDNVSRRHAVVRQRGDGYEIEDLRSTNGTRVNGQPVAGSHPLHDGDRLAFADVEVEFRVGGGSRAAQQSAPAPDETWHPQDSTATDQPPAQPGGNRSETLRQELHDTPGFSGWALLLAVGGSVVGTVFSGAAGTGPWGTLAGAAVGPVVSTVFSTKKTGEKGRVRAAAIVILSLCALVITWAGFEVTDAAAGKSVVPGTGDRSSTFPGGSDPTSSPSPHETPKPGPTASGTAIVEVDPVECGSVTVGSAASCSTTIRYHGNDRLHITGVDVTGADSGDFSAGRECVDTWLDPGGTCAMTVQFQPSATGKSSATLVVHQNLPRPDRGTTTSLTGSGQADPGTCLDGYVWREAVPGDHVCVTPGTRAQAQEDNSLADSRRNPAGGAYGPDTCLDGYVWREAVASDHVCVTPETRSQTREDNRLAPSRRAG